MRVVMTMLVRGTDCRAGACNDLQRQAMTEVQNRRTAKHRLPEQQLLVSGQMLSPGAVCASGFRR